MDERKRDSMVAYLRRRMVEFGIKPEDLAASMAADQRRQHAAKYRNASGEIWDGHGDMPQWLVQATSAGQSSDHFAVRDDGFQRTVQRAGVNWANDPFAGTRLAAANPLHPDTR
jgi:DNA-binding protein H-NS